MFYMRESDEDFNQQQEIILLQAQRHAKYWGVSSVELIKLRILQSEWEMAYHNICDEKADSAQIKKDARMAYERRLLKYKERWLASCN
jgi:hypothetical protein